MKTGLWAVLGLALVTPSAYAQDEADDDDDSAESAPASVAPEPKSIRKIVVAPFAGVKESRARAGVLSALADHDDVEVVSMDDITFAARRLAADPALPAGRAKLSAELGIGGWLDGQTTEDSVQMTLTSSEGARVAAVKVEAPQPKQLEALAGERMWAAMGTHLSPREGYRRELLAVQDKARLKLEAREAEAERQKGLVKQAFVSKNERLAAENQRARQKRTAVQEALAHQVVLAKEYQGPPLKESRRVVTKPRGGSRSTPVVGARRVGPSVTGISSPKNPIGPNGVSQTTQHWLDQQGHERSGAQPGYPPPVVSNERPADAAGSGISPATQRWLSQQRIR